MRFILAFILFLPFIATAQKTDTTKRERRLKDISADLYGGYSTESSYTAGIWAQAHFRKFDYGFNVQQSILRTQNDNFSVISYRGLGTNYYNYGRTPATTFPETFGTPFLNRLTKQASGSISWQSTKKLKIDLYGSYKWYDDTVGFAVQRQIFTGSNFRTMHSTHSGGLITEKKSVALELKYPSYADSPIIKFKSSLDDEMQDLTLTNHYSDTTSGHPWGFMADATNREISNHVYWASSASMQRLWLPWVRFDDYRPAYTRKYIRLNLAHVYRMESEISHLFTRTDLVPENGLVVPGSDRIYYINNRRPSNEFTATLSMSDLVKIKKPDIEINFVIVGLYSEQPWMQRATRIDGTGANPENELYINSTLTTKLITPALSYWYKTIGFVLKGQSAEIAVRDESGGAILKRKFMLLPQLKFIFQKIEVQYTSEMLSPGAVTLLPNPDWRNPSYIEFSNTSLGFGRENALALERGFYRTKISRKDTTMKLARWIRIDANITHYKKPVMWIAQPDSSGILNAGPVNLPSLLNTSAGINFEQQFYPAFRLTGSIGHDWLHYDYPLNDAVQTMNHQTFRAQIACGYQPTKNTAMRVYAGYTLVHADYTSEKRYTRDYQSFNAGAWYDFKIFDRLRFYLIGTVVHYVGPQQMEEKSILYASTVVEWFKSEGRFSVRLLVNDLFNQNIYFERNDAHGMVYQVNGVASGRYAMLTASLRISK